jgi:hypothetical protein
MADGRQRMPAPSLMGADYTWAQMGILHVDSRVSRLAEALYKKTLLPVTSNSGYLLIPI